LSYNILVKGAGIIMSKKIEKQKESFESILKRLEEIVDLMEKGLPLEESIKLYEEGVILSKKLQERLSKIERRVYEIKNMDKLISEKDKDVELGLFQE
jgi:exodeoxyribonuclease VII small subunit